MNEHYKFVNKPLPYAYDALEPYIDEKTMHLHHDKHLQTYVDNLNKALEDCKALQQMTLCQLICNENRIPKHIRTAVKNNAGGVYNHNFYFDGMINSDIKQPFRELGCAINNRYGSFEQFKTEFKKTALAVFGSGYAWLVMNKARNLCIMSTANQDTPLTDNLCPLLTIDVWEHAYYLKHYNKRADYIDDWFHVVNWERANELYIKG